MTPTIVSIIEKSTDTSIFYSVSEEELSHKEIKAVFCLVSIPKMINLAGLTSSHIQSENLSRHDNVAAEIFIPPPEQV